MTSVEQKVRKLLALSQSPNEHEAQAAADAARRLMLRHGIEAAQLVEESEDLGIREQHVESKLDPWRTTLATAVARSSGGDVLRANRYRKWSGTLMFFGPRDTVSGMVQTYEFLEREIDRLSKEAAAVESAEVGFVNAAESMRWRRSWLQGCAERVALRLRARGRRDEQEADSTGTALVRLRDAVKDAIHEAHPSTTTDRYRPDVNPHAYRDGVRTGDTVPLGDAELSARREIER